MTTRETFAVEGMSCTGCEDNVTNALDTTPGVRRVEADHEDGTVEVVYDEDETESTALADAIHQAGYDVAG